MRNKQNTFFFICLLIILVGGCGNLLEKAREERRQRRERAVNFQKEIDALTSSAEEIHISKLLEELKTDETVADTKYKNKKLWIKGGTVIEYFTENESKYVEIKLEKHPNSIHCYYTEPFDRYAELYIKNRSADVYGEYKGFKRLFDGTVLIFENCAITRWGVNMSTPNKPLKTPSGKWNY